MKVTCWGASSSSVVLEDDKDGRADAMDGYMNAEDDRPTDKDGRADARGDRTDDVGERADNVSMASHFTNSIFSVPASLSPFMIYLRSPFILGGRVRLGCTCTENRRDRSSKSFTSSKTILLRT